MKNSFELHSATMKLSLREVTVQRLFCYSKLVPINLGLSGWIVESIILPYIGKPNLNVLRLFETNSIKLLVLINESSKLSIMPKNIDTNSVKLK